MSQGGRTMHCFEGFDYYLEEEFLTKLSTNFMNEYQLDLPSASKIALDVIEILRFTDSLTPSVSDALFS